MEVAPNQPYTPETTPSCSYLTVGVPAASQVTVVRTKAPKAGEMDPMTGLLAKGSVQVRVWLAAACCRASASMAERPPPTFFHVPDWQDRHVVQKAPPSQTVGPRID